MALTFLVPFVVLLVVSAPQGLASRVSSYNVAILATAREAAATFGGSDAGSLLNAAMSWVDHGAIGPAMHWVYNFWPPGMVIVEVPLIALERATGIPTVLSMVVLNCAIWGAFLAICYRFVQRRSGVLPAALLVAALFLSTAVTGWGTDSGLFYSDSYGAIAFCLSLLLVVRVAEAESTRGRLRNAALAGVFLAGAAYFRTPFELIALIALIACAALVVVGLVLSRLPRAASFTAWSRTVALPVGVVALVAQALILPWRLYASLRIRPGDFRWSTVSDLASSARWLPDQFLMERGIWFGIHGHSNWACISDRELCQEIFELESRTPAPYSGGPDGHYTLEEFDQLTLQAFFAHPGDFILERFRALAIGFASNDGASIKAWAIPESILIAAALVAVIVVLVRRRRLLGAPSAYFLGALAVQVAMLTLMHQEPRYYLAIELAIIVMAGLVIPTARGDGPFSRRRAGADPPVAEEAHADTKSAM